MLNNVTAKTKLGPRLKAWTALALLGLVSAVFVGVVLLVPRGDATRSSVRIGGSTYSLEVVATEPQQTRGLSGRTSLDRRAGMLFVYDRAERVCMWMKDMHLSLDIVWLDNGKRVLHIEREVSPDTYPATFCPNTAARYVIELPAGTARATGLEVGDVLNF